LRHGKQRGDRHTGQRQQQRKTDADRDRRHRLERARKTVPAEQGEKDQADREPGQPAADDHAPLAKILCKSVAAGNGWAPRLYAKTTQECVVLGLTKAEHRARAPSAERQPIALRAAKTAPPARRKTYRPRWRRLSRAVLAPAMAAERNDS